MFAKSSWQQYFLLEFEVLIWLAPRSVVVAQARRVDASQRVRASYLTGRGLGGTWRKLVRVGEPCMDPSLAASGAVETPNLISVNSPDIPVDKCEQLGSVTHNQETDGLITGQIRSSARVYKKMRLDSGSLSTSLEKKGAL
uniref:(California timema) hypothetical protein n=1 Tax=Timema californicum TaxID=61474 RepID=A0A7R9PD21_TIMCA|nr:unnamed protein product [Timema californicum]